MEPLKLDFFSVWNISEYLEYTEWICLLTGNMQNESVSIYTENTQNAWKVEYLRAFETKIENITGRLSRAQMRSFGQTSLNQKISW
jgi:hypothetical protein